MTKEKDRKKKTEKIAQKSHPFKDKLKEIPRKPGVYLFKDQTEQVIYIGKALSLKDRVRSYFNPRLTDPKTKLMIAHADSLEHQVVASEFEALLLEANLIKKYQPKYNIQLKDNKHYLYIAITQPPFRIFPTRRPELEKNLLDWYGPFPSSTDVRRVLQILRRIFPYCSHPNIPQRQCLYYHLKLCPGFQNLTTVDYQKDITHIRRVLKGQSRLLLKRLTRGMKEASKELRYEQAQNYKNQIESLQNLTQGWRPLGKNFDTSKQALFRLKKLLTNYQGIAASSLNKIEGYDISNLGNEIIVGAMVAFVDGLPEKGLYRKFKIRKEEDFHPRGVHSAIPVVDMEKGNPRGVNLVHPGGGFIKKQNDPGSIKQIIARRLNHPEWLFPQLILVDGGKPQISAAFAALREKELAGQICILGLAKSEETVILPKIENKKITGWRSLHYSTHSPILQLLQQIRDESHRFAQKYYKSLHWAGMKKTK